MARVHDETEWQFDADDLEAVARIARSLGGGITAAPGEERRLTDRYYDTSDWRLYSANYSLRIRHSGQSNESTLKQLVTAHGGPVTRREISEACDDVDRLGASTGPVGVRLRDVLGQIGSLRELFRVQTRRRSFALVNDARPDAHAAELVADDTWILDTSGHVIRRLRRVEIEAEDPAAVSDYVLRLRERGGLRPVSGSKFDAGLEAAGLRPWLRFPRHPALTADLSATEFGLRTIRVQADRLLRHESMARIADDPEGVHQMRLAARTIRAIVRLFRGTLPDNAERLRHDLRALGRALGPARELDVELAMLDDFVARTAPDSGERIAPLRQLLCRERAAAQATLIEYLDGDAYRAVTCDLERLASDESHHAGKHGAKPIREFAPALMRRAYRRVTRERPAKRRDVTSDELHRLRIRTKEARYALRAVAPIYGPPVTEAVRTLHELQRLLGTTRDRDVAAARLRVLERQDAPGTDASVIQALAGFYEEESGSRLGRIREAYVQATGKTRKRAMRELRRAAQRKE